MNRTRIVGKLAIVVGRVENDGYPLLDPCSLTEDPACGSRSWGGIRLRLPRSRRALTLAWEGRSIPGSWRGWRRRLVWRLRGRPEVAPMGVNNDGESRPCVGRSEPE